MGKAALRIARAVDYLGAGTVEFLVSDVTREFYFLEMNTRLQVEHPVTELVTGIDLVREQIKVAAGDPLSVKQPDVHWRGHAIECRVYAEDPDDNFMPSPGKITRNMAPAGPGIRLDSGVYEGFTVPMEYDPLLAKLAVWAGTRDEAIARMSRALGEYFIGGIRTNLDFFRRVVEDPQFREGRLDTGFIARFLARRPKDAENPELETLAALVAALHVQSQGVEPSSAPNSSRWRSEGREELFR